MKKVLSFVLAFAMVLGLLPAMSFAANEPLEIVVADIQKWDNGIQDGTITEADPGDKIVVTVGVKNTSSSSIELCGVSAYLTADASIFTPEKTGKTPFKSNWYTKNETTITEEELDWSLTTGTPVSGVLAIVGAGNADNAYELSPGETMTYAKVALTISDTASSQDYVFGFYTEGSYKNGASDSDDNMVSATTGTKTLKINGEEVTPPSGEPLEIVVADINKWDNGIVDGTITEADPGDKIVVTVGVKNTSSSSIELCGVSAYLTADASIFTPEKTGKSPFKSAWYTKSGTTIPEADLDWSLTTGTPVSGVLAIVGAGNADNAYELAPGETMTYAKVALTISDTASSQDYVFGFYTEGSYKNGASDSDDNMVSATTGTKTLTINGTSGPSAEEIEFESYKTTQKSAADALAQAGDSAECATLITNAKSAIDAISYDGTMSLADNKALVDAVITTLTADLAAQRAADQLEADKAEFASYKTTKKAAADALAQVGDSAACATLITNAKSAIDALAYDESKDLATNKAALDAIVTSLDTALATQRAADALAALVAEFDSYKITKKSAADALSQPGDSAACAALVTNAKSAIDALSYDEGKSLSQNKAALDAIVTALQADLTAQRIAETPVLTSVESTKTNITVDGSVGDTAALTAKDGNGETVTGVTWSVSPSGKGVTVASDGAVTVSADARSGDYTFTATPNGTTVLGSPVQKVISVLNTSIVTTVTLSCENAEIYVGAETVLALDIDKNPGFSGVWLTPVYDSDVFEIDAENGSLFEHFEKGINYIWVEEEGADVSAVGTLCNLTVKVKSTATAGDYTIKLTPYQCYNADEESVDITEVTFTVTVKDLPVLTTVTSDKSGVTVDGTNGGTASLTAKDENGTAVTGVTWSVSPADKGVTVSSNGTVTVTAKAKAGVYVFTATADGTTVSGDPVSSANFTVTRAASVATAVTISGGQAAIVVPALGAPAATTAPFTATVYDQYEEVMETSVTWTIEPPYTGASIASGVVTITSEAAITETPVVVKATAGTASATTTLNLTKADSVATTVVISGGQSQITLPTPGAAAATGTAFTAKVYDQYGKEIDAEVVWTIDPAYAGASVSAGAVTITDAASVGTVTVKATSGTASATTTITVSKASSVATTVELANGQSAMIIPALTESAITGTAFTATVKDQYGETMTAPVTWTIDPAYTGASVSSGAVTIDKTATAGTVTVKATSGTAIATTSVTLSKAASVATTVEIAGGQSELILPAPGEAAATSAAFTATVKDQYGENMTASVTWSIDPVKTGVSVSADGKVTIDNTASAGTVTVKATAGTAFATTTVTVSKASSVATTVEISGGQSAMTIPALTEAAVTGTAFTATVKDQYGETMTADVTWTIDPAYTGASVSNGAVTIDKTASVGTVTVKATSGTAIAMTTVTLSKAASVATTVEIAGGQSEITLPTPGAAAATGTAFTAKVYDQYGVEMNETVTWTIDPAYAGASVSEGAVTITDAASVGTVTVKATAGTASATATVSVIKAASVATSVSISGGQNEAEVPAVENSPAALTPFTATVYNQYGDEMSASVTWTIDPAYTGVTVSNGVVSVYNSAIAGSFTVKATAGAAVATTTVTLSDNTFDLPVSASEPQVFVKSVKTLSDKTISVEVFIKNNPGFASLTLKPFFPEELTLAGVQNGDLISGFATSGTDYVWTSAENATEDGKLATFTFEVPDGTAPGEYKIRFKVRECVTADEQNVAIKVSTGTVTVISMIYGDANGDTLVDLRDVIRIMKYEAALDYNTGISTVEIFDGADVNVSGEIDVSDAILLMQYFAAYDIATQTSTVQLGE